jgi:hypothetical protein
VRTGTRSTLVADSSARAYLRRSRTRRKLGPRTNPSCASMGANSTLTRHGKQRASSPNHPPGIAGAAASPSRQSGDDGGGGPPGRGEPRAGRTEKRPPGLSVSTCDEAHVEAPKQKRPRKPDRRTVPDRTSSHATPESTRSPPADSIDRYGCFASRNLQSA